MRIFWLNLHPIQPNSAILIDQYLTWLEFKANTVCVESWIGLGASFDYMPYFRLLKITSHFDALADNISKWKC